MKKAVLLTAVAALFFSMMVLPAAADTIGAGTFTGTAKVAAGQAYTPSNPCVDPTGPQGLGFPDPTNLTKVGGWRLHTTNISATGVFHGEPKEIDDGELDACGQLGPNAKGDGIGASCGMSGGHSGIGKLRLSDTVKGNDAYYNLSNLGWKTSAGGFLPVTGTYEERSGADKSTKTGKTGTITAMVFATGGADCATKAARDFTVVGTVTFTQ